MKLDLVDENTGELIESIEVNDTTWEALQAYAKKQGVTEEHLFNVIMHEYAKQVSFDEQDA